MRKWAWSPATATWATDRSRFCGGPHECGTHLDSAGTRTANADADAREPALLGRPARRPFHAPALRQVRKGAALSSAGLSALLLHGKHLAGGAARRPHP